MVKNYIEELVDQAIAQLIKDKGDAAFRCTCETCMDSIKAIALNAIPPFYITTKVGEVYGTYRSLESQNRVDVLSHVLAAQIIVEQNPKHKDVAADGTPLSGRLL